jgi:glutamate racemase
MSSPSARNGEPGTPVADALRKAPIGVFDSGVGGLSVLREIMSQLPYERTIYLADQAHIPYGPRTQDEIQRFSHAITSFLVECGAKAIVVACNTASGVALHPLRAAFPDLPFIGMEPAVKPAVEHTASGVVGVLATPTTFQGQLFRRLVDRFGRNVVIHTQTCPGLVEAIERGELDTDPTRNLLSRCLQPLLDHNIDQLVLGCTHYPFVAPLIKELAGPSVAIIDPAPAVARQVARVLNEREMLTPPGAPPQHCFYTTGDDDSLATMASRFAGLVPHTEHTFWSDESIRIGGCGFL